MTKTTNPIICADVIAMYGKKYVFVERKTNPVGLALVGGEQDLGEHLSHTAEREFFEETGLKVKCNEVFGVYAEPNRDPRGFYVSCVFTGFAEGWVIEEAGKTEVVFLTKEEILNRIDEFVFDHAKIIKEYFKF